jgi:hypothetical protein
MRLTFNFLRFSTLIAVLLICATATLAQTTAFTYQGRFTDSTLPQPTNGSYEMQYKLFDTSVVGTGLQNGNTLTVSSVSVVNGIFTVQLDFGGGAFRANSIFIEIGVRPVGSAAAFTVLGPRQQITAAPLAVRSQISDLAEIAGNSAALGGIIANQYVQTNDARLADDRNPTAGSPNYIQNQSAVSQSANLKINGNATVGGTVSGNTVDAGTQFNLGGSRFLSGGSGNVIAGSNAGTTTTGGDNSFFGTNAGMTNATGFNNALFGTDAGRNNTAANNSFFGRSAGFATTTGGSNSFFGLDAGRFNTTGGNNAFFGLSAGQNNTMGSNNSALGYSANFSVSNLSFATAIGAGSVVSTSNTIALGRNDGSDTVRIFGLGAAGGTTLCRNASNQISTCTASSGSFIDNSTALQATSNFNISGNGTVGGTVSGNIVNSATNFRIGGTPVFSTPNGTSVVIGQSANHNLVGSNSTFLGFKAGQVSNSFSQANTFMGSEAGESNTGGENNSFVGKDAGFFNTTGSLNSFFGSSAGKSNSTADANSFFGYESGLINSTGTRNSFFGFQTGRASQTVNDNSFFGYQSGTVATGGGNSFFGSLAGKANNGGSDNAFFGSSAGLANVGGSSNTFIGGNAGYLNTNGSSNTVVGNQSSSKNGNENIVVGSGSQADGSQNTMLGGGSFSTGNANISIGNFTSVEGSDNTVVGNSTRVRPFTPGFPGPTFATAIGAGAVADSSNSVVLGRSVDFVKVPGNLNVSSSIFASSVKAGLFETTGGIKLTAINSWTGNDTPLCRNGNNFLSNCPPNFAGNSAGFTKEQNTQIATQAEEIKQQQTTIGKQAEQIKLLQKQMDALKETVCAMNPKAELCSK